MLNAILRKDLKRKAIKSNDPSIWNPFRTVRNQVNRKGKTLLVIVLEISAKHDKVLTN